MGRESMRQHDTSLHLTSSALMTTADATPDSPSAPFHNRTRTSRSIPRRLLRQGRAHLLPVYALMRTSDLGREGIDHSGSYRFADHIYRNVPSGRFGIGRLLDAALLRLRGARSMRNRFFHVQREIVAARRRAATSEEFRVLAVPCGIARDLVQAARTLRREDPTLAGRTTFFGIDLDPEPLELSRRLASGLANFHFARGDALDSRAYPPALDLIASTGLGEFLGDAQLARLYAVCRGALREGGVLVTSGMRRDPLADYLARELAELHTHYRGPAELTRMLTEAGFAAVTAVPDEVGLQTLVVARVEPDAPGADRG
jgi:SAM-dependent methyltransferase